MPTTKIPTACPNCAALLARALKAEEELARLKARTGRPLAAPTTDDGRLAEEVRLRTRMTQGALEAALGCGSGVLSKVRAGERDLPPEHRKVLEAMRDAAPPTKPTKKK